MYEFDKSQSYGRLLELGKAPFDLAKAGRLSYERYKQMQREEGPFKFFYFTERVDEEVLCALFNLAKEAAVGKKMRDMQEGKKINRVENCFSENRAVLHTAMRDFFENKITAPLACEAALLAKVELDKLKAKLHLLERFENLVQVGIGGSDLGPRAVYQALKAYSNQKKVFFISNVDPDDCAFVLKGLDLKKTLFLVVSKSGTTLETLTNEELIRFVLRKAGLDPKEHIAAITGRNSPMDDPQRYLLSFYMWDYVGGRYSVTSMVGAVSLVFALGFDNYLEFLKGANWVDKYVLENENNLPLFAALLSIWNKNFLNTATEVILPYSQGLELLPAHLQQLAMESNGKGVDRSGRLVSFATSPVIWGSAGTIGQHSYYQLLHQGRENFHAEFIGFVRSQYDFDLEVKGTTSQEKLLANLIAQSIAFAKGKKDKDLNRFFPGNHPSTLLVMDELTPYNMGALLAFYEHKTVYQGFIWNINSFDQEGVQLGKILAEKILNIYSSFRPQSFDEIYSRLLKD